MPARRERGARARTIKTTICLAPSGLSGPEMCSKSTRQTARHSNARARAVLRFCRVRYGRRTRNIHERLFCLDPVAMPDVKAHMSVFAVISLRRYFDNDLPSERKISCGDKQNVRSRVTNGRRIREPPASRPPPSTTRRVSTLLPDRFAFARIRHPAKNFRRRGEPSVRACVRARRIDFDTLNSRLRPVANESDTQ